MKNKEVHQGDRIRIKEMVGEPRYTGVEGAVTFIDDNGQLHGTWGGLAIQPERDSFEVIPKKDDKRQRLFEQCYKDCQHRGDFSALNLDFTIQERITYKTILDIALDRDETRLKNIV